MVYIFDTSAFIVISHYYPARFPSFWSHLNALAEAKRLLSVSEVWKELDNASTRQHLAIWLKSHSGLFATPSSQEMAFVARIFAVPAFQALVKEKGRLKGSPVADPFVITRAAVLGGVSLPRNVSDRTPSESQRSAATSASIARMSRA